MKTIITALTMMMAATVANAEGLFVQGHTEYAIEADTFEVGLGTGYEYKALEVSVYGDFVKLDNFDLEFDSVEVAVSYDLTDNVNLYTSVEFDENLDYTETTAGLAFRF